MKKAKRIFFSIIIIALAIVSSGLCIYRYGMGIQTYYEEQMGDVTTIVADIYWLEGGTAVEQLFESSALYMAGVDVILVGVGEENQGTLYVQLYDYDGNLLAQKLTNLYEIEDGQLYQVRFLNIVDISNYQKLRLRIFVANSDKTPGLVSVAASKGSKDSILCFVNDEPGAYNLAVNYLYGKRGYVGYGAQSDANRGALAGSIFFITLVSSFIFYLIWNKKRFKMQNFVDSWKSDVFAAVEIIHELVKGKGNAKYICYIIGIILYFVAFLGVLLFPSLTYLTYQKLARGGFMVSLLLTVLADLFLIIGRKFISKNTKQQMLSIYLITAAFFVPMFVRNLMNGNHNYGYFNWIELTVILIGLFFWGGQLIWLRSPINIKKYSWILALIILTVVGLSIEQLSIVMKGDSVEYYSKIIRICQNFSFSPNDISLLKSSGHSCYSYSLFSTIGENIIPYFGMGVRIETIVIWAICIIFMWKILKRLNPNISALVLTGCVSFFALTPLILSNIQEISVEIYVLLFFILFFYFNISNKHILEMFFAICFVFAKEPNILILAGYYFGMLIYQIIQCKKNEKAKFFEKDFTLSSISIYIAAVVFCLYFVVDVTWGINSSFDYSNVTQGNTFGVNGVLIASKLKQLFILNFAWLPSVAIVVGYIFCKLRKRKFRNKSRHFWTLLFSYLCFLLTQMFYLTFVLPRYIMLQYFYLIIVTAFILEELSINRKVLQCIVIGSTCVILCQNYYNIDILSSLVFNTLDTGNGHMIFDNPLYVGIQNEFITYKDGEVPYVQPYGMTNRQFSYFDKLLEKALCEIEYEDGDLIVLPLCFKSYSDNFYWGNHLEIYYFDTKNKRFVQLVNEHVPEPNDIVKLDVVQLSQEYYFTDFKGYRRVFYLDFSFADDVNKFIQEYYKTELVKDLSYRGWTLGIYQIEGKN